jgi:hypothetical protein
MAKIIRPAYPLEFSIGLLLLIFVLSSFLSFEIFDVKWHQVMAGGRPLLGMILAGLAVVIMSLILWEEFLFPVRLKPAKDQIIFRNHFTKLKTQALIYCAIPVIVGFVYSTYDVSTFPFFIWASICLIAPLAGKLISGIKNYNDFLKISDGTIEYKNNEKEGVLPLRDVREIILIRDEEDVLHKLEVVMANDKSVIIDLDEMELEAYYDTIDDFIQSHYKAVLKSAKTLD